MFRLKLFFKNASISNFLILCLVLIFSAIIINGYLSIKFLDNYLKNNTIIINHLGIIRGDIQRYVKLKLVHQESKKIEKEIDKIFHQTCELIKNKQFLDKKKFFEFHSQAKYLWEKIKTQNNDLIKLSEKEWKVTNKMVFYTQNLFNKKFYELKQTYITIISATSFLVLILIFTIYRLIKKGMEIDIITDPLTKLYNRAYFNEQIVYHIEKYNRFKEPFVMLLFDIDNFKKINDTFGHQKGDEVLQKIGEIIKESIRKTDLAFRYGGEEFAIIFPNTTLSQANTILNRFLTNLKTIQINNNSITISGGMGEYKGEGILDFIKNIDEALYEVKQQGKNKIKLI